MRREKRAKKTKFVCLSLPAPLSPASCDCDDANGTCGRHDVAADADAAADANSVAFVAAYSYLFGAFCCRFCCLAAKWAAWHNNKCCRRSVFALVTHTHTHTVGCKTPLLHLACIRFANAPKIVQLALKATALRLCVCVYVCCISLLVLMWPVGDSWQGSLSLTGMKKARSTYDKKQQLQTGYDTHLHKHAHSRTSGASCLTLSLPLFLSLRVL